jgi:CspA family cold shock protein
MEGVIKRIVAEKGYGFIRTHDGKEEYFFHRSACSSRFDELVEGQNVTFTVVNSPKGPRAESVEIA